MDCDEDSTNLSGSTAICVKEDEPPRKKLKNLLKSEQISAAARSIISDVIINMKNEEKEKKMLHYNLLNTMKRLKEQEKEKLAHHNLSKAQKRIKELESKVDEKTKEVINEKAEKELHLKLSSIMFSKWVLDLFKNLVLSKFNANLVSKPTAEAMKNAWISFFDEASDSSDQMEMARKCIIEKIQEDNLIMKEIQRSQTTPETHSNVITKTWIGRQSSELYERYSSIVNILSKINWILDKEYLRLAVFFSPNINDFDRELITILHTTLVELFIEDISAMP